MKICPKCGTEHNKPGKFCTQSCANRRPSLVKGLNLVEKIERKCVKCDSVFFTSLLRNKKFCSNDCWKQDAGGYRVGSGRAKTGYYKGIYCGSTYELVWVIYNLDHNIQFIRFPGFLEKEGIKYYPDFLKGLDIIELKGYEKQEAVDRKTRVAEQCGYSVLILRKENLETEFGWVKTHYSYKELYELYDGYKPKYSLSCSHCGVIFTRNHKQITNNVFCSRSCAGLGHTGAGNTKGYNQYVAS